jgi:hypothetical protein
LSITRIKQFKNAAIQEDLELDLIQSAFLQTSYYWIRAQFDFRLTIRVQDKDTKQELQ